MASKKKGKPLVIVESPAKARTISRYLGDGFRVEASIGHVRDLPANATEVPASVKKEKWSRLGIDVENDFRPLYVVPSSKKDQLRKLRAALKDAAELYLATDEDREGESISWHLVQELSPKVDVRRLVFHEITNAAIKDALENPREIDMDLVEAQETRRLVDRLYGYSVSPLLWKKVRPKLSAGRVQSVAIRLIVEREQDRIRFVPADYWTLKGVFAEQGDEPTPFEANLLELDGRRIALGKDFDGETGDLKKTDRELLQLDEKRALALANDLAGRPAEVESLEKKPYTERPAPPFTTSTLQQEAARKLRFGAQRTMRAAQRLYENGYITYMRTDSTSLSKEALSAARGLIAKQYGSEYVPDSPREYQTKVKNAQEAHEAIRPAGSEFVPIKDLGRDMGADERKIYELIWRRTVACQMKNAEGHRTVLTIGMKTGGGEAARFQATGKTIDFPGYRLAYIEEEEDVESAVADQERILPSVEVGQDLDTRELVPEGHTTQPPPRLTEAGLIKELEARGIGRPSTYAAIIETILARDYCFKKGNALVPTFTAFAVVRLLREYLSWLVDYAFTAKMEDDLDEISNGRQSRLDYLEGFYKGNGKPGLRDKLESVEQEIDPREVCSIPLGKNGDGEVVEVRVGKYGPFLSCGEQRTSVPDQMPPDEMTLEKAQELLAKGGDGPRSLGHDPETGLEVFVKTGRFGPYFQLGDPEELDEKPKMASLLKGMEPDTVTLDDALAVLALPRVVGVSEHPESGDEEEVLAAHGRYGPYLRWGKDTRSIPDEDSPLTIGLEKALWLFSQPKRGRGGRGRATRKVIKELGDHPESGDTVRILDGRYGPYVTDGSTNASLPKGEELEAVDMSRAVTLLAERAARGGKKKKKKTAKKAKKKTRKKTTAKKTGK